MKPPQRHHGEELLPKWLEVWSVAETARADSHHLAVFAKQLGRERKETRVEIACLDSGLTQQASRARVAANLAVGRIENGRVERCLGRAEQIAANERNCDFNEIVPVEFRRKLNPVSAALNSA